MPLRRLRAVRFARAWVAGPAGLIEDEIALERGDRTVPATLVRPRPPSGRPVGRLPGWIVLHGITRPGRAHPQLVRFTRGLASTGAAAIVPEVPEWRELSLSPHLAAPTVRAAVAGLRISGAVRDEPVGVVGFSFGAPHAVAASGHPELSDDVAGSIAFGGYCDLERTIRFMMTGAHDWSGRAHHLRPDPYGRWIVAANYLTAAPGHEAATDVARALRRLAAQAGEAAVPSWDPCYDPLKDELRRSIAEERRTLFDLLAPHSSRDLDPTAALPLADELAAAARRVDPAIEPAGALASVRRQVHVLHGRRDHLIPFSEGMRLHDTLPAPTRSRLTVTGLFGHSAQDPLASLLRSVSEAPRFLRALDQALALV